MLPSRSDKGSAAAVGVSVMTFGISGMASAAQPAYAHVIKDEPRKTVMETQARDLAVVITHGIDDELSSVGLVIALGGMTAGLKVSIVFSSAGVD